jgi:hypothetical protein
VDVVHALHVGHALCYLVWGSKVWRDGSSRGLTAPQPV